MSKRNWEKARNRPRMVRATDLDQVPGGAERVAVPWRGNRWVCPHCEVEIEPLDLLFYGKPPKYADLLHDIIKCPHCLCAFAPRSEATVLRR